MGMEPIMRYIPSRKIMQRLVRRASALTADYEKAEASQKPEI